MLPKFEASPQTCEPVTTKFVLRAPVIIRSLSLRTTMMFSTTPQWLSAVIVLLLTVFDCKAIRGVSRRRTEFSLEYNTLYNGTNDTARDEHGGYVILHQVDFASHENILDVDVDAEARDEDDKTKKQKRRKRPKRPKASKIELRAEPKKTKGTIMPTVSSALSSMSSISNQPTVSAAPSTSPTVTPQPSMSSAPSTTPTVSFVPTLTASPTIPPALAALSEPSATSALTSENPAVGAPRVEVLNKFALAYLLKGDPSPTQDHYFQLATATGWYLSNHSKSYYDVIPQVIYIQTEITSYYEPSPFVIDYDAMTCFAQHASFPSQDQLDGVIAIAFTSGSDSYIAFLKSNLPQPNPFSNTKSIEYSTYWEALATQKSQAASDEQTDMSNPSNIYAPIVAIAGTLILIAGIFIVARERKRRHETSRVNNNRWDETGANLHLTSRKELVEEDTVLLDGPSPTGGEHSYIPREREFGSLSPVEEVDFASDDGAVVMGDSSEPSPSEVMRKMNLSSALEDIDLDTESGQVGELPGRHDRGGIGELPGSHEN